MRSPWVWSWPSVLRRKDTSSRCFRRSWPAQSPVTTNDPAVRDNSQTLDKWRGTGSARHWLGAALALLDPPRRGAKACLCHAEPHALQPGNRGYTHSSNSVSSGNPCGQRSVRCEPAPAGEQSGQQASRAGVVGRAWPVPFPLGPIPGRTCSCANTGVSIPICKSAQKEERGGRGGHASVDWVGR